MKLTTKGRYAVMAMADLASNVNAGPISLTEISLRQNISLAYLEQIFIKLKNKKLVKSARGAAGGYILEKPASDIKLSNIIFAVDEEGIIVDIFQAATLDDRMPFERLEAFIPESRRCKCNREDCITSRCREMYEEIRQQAEAMVFTG